LIQPRRGAEPKSAMVGFFYGVMTPLFAILRKFPGTFTDTINIGKAMINIALNGYEKKHLSPGDINRLAG